MNLFGKVAVVVVALASSGVAQAEPILLFNNGLPLAEDHILRRNGQYGSSTYLTIYDDFSLAADAVVTDLHWYQLNHRRIEEFVLYQNTTISIWAGQPKTGELLLEFVVEAISERDSSFSYSGDLSQTDWYGYEFSVSGLDYSLAAGSYWLGIQNNDYDNGSNWAMTSVRNDDLAGRWQGVDWYCPGERLCDESLNFIESEDSAFSVSGRYVSVPEPSTLALLGLGLLGMAARRRHKV